MLNLTWEKHHDGSSRWTSDKKAEREMPGSRNDLQGATRTQGGARAISRYRELPSNGFRSAEKLLISLSAYMPDMDIAGDIRNIVKLRRPVNHSYLDDKTRQAYHEEPDRFFHIARK